MAGELWRELLPLLRAGDLVAWNQVIERHFNEVYGGLLIQARRRNSSHHGPLADPDVQDLARTLTDEAFLAGIQKITTFDAERASLPTWIYWLGMGLSKGLLDPLLRPEQARAAQRNFDTPGGARLASVPSAERQLLRASDLAELRARIAAILAAMPVEWATALVQVALVRDEGHANPIQVAASLSGRSPVAMDSMLRRATRDFRARWMLAYGSSPITPAE